MELIIVIFKIRYDFMFTYWLLIIWCLPFYDYDIYKYFIKSIVSSSWRLKILEVSSNSCRNVEHFENFSGLLNKGLNKYLTMPPILDWKPPVASSWRISFFSRKLYCSKKSLPKLVVIRQWTPIFGFRQIYDISNI